MIEYQQRQLSNGLMVLLHQDSSTPLVAVNMLFRAGSKYDPPDKTGLAHLFEHLMFSGTDQVPNFDIPVQLAGGENNAFTNSDYADYYTYGPAKSLEAFLWLESDRLEHLRLRPQEFAVQQKVVIEELFESCLSLPYGDVWHHLLPMVYRNFPYAWPTIGRSDKELETITLDDIKSFYRRYYHVSNAILSVAGNIDPSQTDDWVDQYFGQINGTAFPIPEFAFDTKDNVPHRIVIESDVPSESFYLVFPMPGRGDPSYYSLDLFSDLLALGRSSMLYQKFIKENQWLSNVDAYITGNIDTGLFVVEGRLAPAAVLGEIEDCFWKMIEQLVVVGIKQSMMQKLRNTSESNFMFSEVGTLNRAINLGYYQLIGDANLINLEGSIYQSLSAEDLLGVVDRFIRPDKASLVHYVPKSRAK